MAARSMILRIHQPTHRLRAEVTDTSKSIGLFDLLVFTTVTLGVVALLISL
jgi:hypothetical protein